MADFPLAETSKVVAVRRDPELVIYVEGFTTGFGGRLLVEQSDDKGLPPQFDIYAEPGNDGINPKASPKHVPTSALAVFQAGGIDDAIRIQDAAGTREIEVRVIAGTTKRLSRTDGWSAVHNMMPGSSHRLVVSGILEAPSTGWSVGLKKKVPQGINPEILLLEVDATEPSVGGALMMKLSVDYEELTEQRYRQVDVLPDGQLLTEEILIDVLDLE